MTMGILNIAPAERAGAHLLIQLYGPPRSGKTYTALRIARGMVGPKGKIGVLDKESGRVRLYSDKVPGGFVVGELTPPYTPPPLSRSHRGAPALRRRHPGRRLVLALLGGAGRRPRDGLPGRGARKEGPFQMARA